MKYSDFCTLNDSDLIRICVEPIIHRVRGKSPVIKSQIIMQLSNGQRSLFLFQVLYGHANQGIINFFHQISYLTEFFNIWSALKSALRYFGDIEMLTFIDRMESTYKQTENTALLNELDEEYNKKISESLRLISTYIRNNAAEFLQFED